MPSQVKLLNIAFIKAILFLTSKAFKPFSVSTIMKVTLSPSDTSLGINSSIKLNDVMPATTVQSSFTEPMPQYSIYSVVFLPLIAHRVSACDWAVIYNFL